jgi:hypothetical protein
MDDLLNRDLRGAGGHPDLEPTYGAPVLDPVRAASGASIRPDRASRPREFDAVAWSHGCRAALPFQPLQRLLAGKTPPLLWGLTDVSDGLFAAARTLHRLSLKPAWSKAAREAVNGVLFQNDSALWALLGAYAAPAVVREDRSGQSGDLLRMLASRLERASVNADPLSQLLEQVELPLVMARYAPDERIANALRNKAIAADATLSAELLDNHGLPKVRLSATMLPWLASLVRAHELVHDCETQFSASARERLARLTRNALRLARPDGGSVLRDQPGSGGDRELLTAAVLAHEAAAPLAALALGKPAKARSTSKLPRAKLPSGTPAAPFYSAASNFAVLRTGWSAPATQLTIDFSGEQVWLDLSSGNRSLLHGFWGLQVQVDGQPANPRGGWSDVCWHSDADCDYLEIEQKLSGGYLLQRHLLLIRRDQALLLADSLLTEAKQTPTDFVAYSGTLPKLAYSSSLPLSSGLTFAPQAETREGQLLVRKQRLAHVLPIALPEWRKQPAAGELTGEGNALKHSLRASARNLFAPLWIDLHPNRQKSPLTWRQLTIGESLAVQPREVAVGYRIQVHSMQWLLYRSLAWRGNRTVLGKNFATDLACCRFLPNGETEDILEVQ